MATKAPHDLAPDTPLSGLSTEVARNDVDRAYNGGNAQLRRRVGIPAPAPAPGYTGTVPLAKLTGGGADGYLEIAGGLITAVLPPT